MANKKSSKNKNGDIWQFTKTILVILLSVVLAVGFLLLGYGWATDFTYNKNAVQQEQLGDELPGDGGGAIITPDDEDNNSKISLSSIQIEPSEYVVYGVSETAESAFLLTAELEPVHTTERALAWSITPEDGKVTVKASSSNHLQATVEVLSAFDTQYAVKVQSVDKPDKYATCKVDYLKALTACAGNSATVTFTSDGYDNPVNFDFSLEPVYGTGTLEGDIRITFSEDFSFDMGQQAVQAGHNYFAENSVNRGKLNTFLSVDFLSCKSGIATLSLQCLKDWIGNDEDLDCLICALSIMSEPGSVVGTFTIEVDYYFLGQRLYNIGDYWIDVYFDTSEISVPLQDIGGLEDIVAGITSN